MKKYSNALHPALSGDLRRSLIDWFHDTCVKSHFFEPWQYYVRRFGIQPGSSPMTDPEIAKEFGRDEALVNLAIML